jgi:hypothetical protein
MFEREHRRRTRLGDPSPARAAPSRSTPAADLQQAYGNRGVASLLARPQAKNGAPADTRTLPAVRATIVMDDPIGVLPLLDFSQNPTSPEITVVVPSTSHDADLVYRTGHAVRLEHVRISTPSFTLELEDVVITGFRPHESEGERRVELTLSFASKTLK